MPASAATFDPATGIGLARQAVVTAAEINIVAGEPLTNDLGIWLLRVVVVVAAPVLYFLEC